MSFYISQVFNFDNEIHEHTNSVYLQSLSIRIAKYTEFFLLEYHDEKSSSSFSKKMNLKYHFLRNRIQEKCKIRTSCTVILNDPVFFFSLLHIYGIESIIIEVEEDDNKIVTHGKERKARSSSEDYIYRFWTDTAFLTLSIDEIIFVFIRSHLKSDSSSVVRYT